MDFSQGLLAAACVVSRINQARTDRRHMHGCLATTVWLYGSFSPDRVSPAHPKTRRLQTPSIIQSRGQITMSHNRNEKLHSAKSWSLVIGFWQLNCLSLGVVSVFLKLYKKFVIES